MNAFTVTLAVIAAYFCGTLPSAIAVARSKGVDITTFGSGNPGASNVGRALGTKYFVIVMAMDALKGVVPVAAMLGDRHVAYMCGAAAVLGHVFPVTRRFRGGKGVATGAGVVLVLHPFILLTAFASWLLLSKVTGKASVASIVAVPVVVGGFVVAGVPMWEVWSVVGIGLLVEVRHLGNIKRLLSGSENRMSGSSS
jgi:glycerol-3-phosphate acyltransferase PlsY